MMKKRITLFISISLFLLLVASNVFSQTKTNDFILSIVVEQNLFSLPQNAKVRVSIENKSGHTITVRELHSVSINLTKYEKNSEACHRDDCFVASFPLRDRTRLKNGESFEFEVDLADLYWNDEISSAYNFNVPKNMSEVIHAGSYYLSVSLYFDAANSTKKDPRVRRIKSNEILVRRA